MSAPSANNDIAVALDLVVRRAMGDDHAPAGPAARRLVEERGRVVSVGRGWRFQEAGQAVSQVGIVMAGVFKFGLIDRRGNEVVTNFGVPGSLLLDFGAVVRGAPTGVAIEAVTDAVLAEFPATIIDEVTQVDPAWELISRRLLEKEFANLAYRIYGLLAQSPADAYREFFSDHAAVAAQIPRKDLAAYLGITPASLSRMSSRLRGDAP